MIVISDRVKHPLGKKVVLILGMVSTVLESQYNKLPSFHASVLVEKKNMNFEWLVYYAVAFRPMT